MKPMSPFWFWNFIKKAPFWRLAILALILAISLRIFVHEKTSTNKEDLLQQSSEENTVKPTVNKIGNKNTALEEIIFPENFFFGTASSDFQTTGGNGLTDWNIYIKNRVKSKNSSNINDANINKDSLKLPFVGPDQGTKFLERYKEDFDLAGQFGDQVHRLSLEWARIEPEEGKWDKKAIEKYKEIFLYMKNVNVEPMICLNHFALPLWFSEQGGWESPKAAFYYARYTETVAREIGLPLRVRWWLTFNEPQVMMLSYTKGNWPPFKSIDNFQDSDGMQRTMLVASHLLDAHRLSYRKIHSVMDKKVNKVMVSFASAPASFYPYDPDSPLDVFIANASTLLHTLSLDYAVGSTDRDFLGINYYGRVKLKLHISLAYKVLPWLSEEKPFAVEWEMPTERKQGNRPKEFYPQALYDLIMRFKIFGLPIVITENGINDVSDKFREEFIVIHLKAVHDAMRDGANIIGYQYWALTDTWEWDGRFSNFGLIEIDRNNDLKKKSRPSAFTYGNIIKTHKISKEILEKHKELLVVQ